MNLIITSTYIRTYNGTASINCTSNRQHTRVISFDRYNPTYGTGTVLTFDYHEYNNSIPYPLIEYARYSQICFLYSNKAQKVANASMPTNMDDFKLIKSHRSSISSIAPNPSDGSNTNIIGGCNASRGSFI